MRKYDALWAYIQGLNEEKPILRFADVEKNCRYTVGSFFFDVQKGACAIWLRGRENQYEVANCFVHQKGK